jgi:hypothetical protein
MGIVYIDGFQTYNNSTANVTGAGWTIVRGGFTIASNQISFSSSNTENQLDLYNCNPVITSTPLSVGYKVSSVSISGNCCFGMGDPYGNHATIALRPSDSTLRYNGAELTTMSTQGSVGLWEFVLTGSEMIAYLDGVEIGRASYSDAINFDTTRCYFYTYNSNITFDLVYIAEGLSNPFGTLNKSIITPSVDSAVQCTPSTGTDNYACVNVHDDSTYNSGTNGQIDKFTGNSPSITGNSIVAVSSRYRGKMTGGASGGIVPIVGNTELGQITLTSDFAEHSVVNTTNPATGNPWTASELNSLVFGYKSVVS